MSHQLALERWAQLLRPVFPVQAALEVRYDLCQLSFSWPLSHVVAIFIAPKAVEDFLSAQDDARARADYNLREFVKDNFRQLKTRHQGEFRIVVASIDFVPLP